MILGEKVIYCVIPGRHFIQDQLPAPEEAEVNWFQGFSARNGLYKPAGSDSAAAVLSQVTHQWSSAWESKQWPCGEPLKEAHVPASTCTRPPDSP